LRHGVRGSAVSGAGRSRRNPISHAAAA
jgi:hypothetical protein